ncbi:MAG TPA: glycoside hydrolase family 15 protein [Acidimicrobiales bacterium]|nr:glycoside hydrolase family 15 protein [Acidimicrobiales bacterium]
MKEAEPGGPGGSRAPDVARSVAAILRSQHPSGAFVASPDFAQYHYCWLRDGSFVAHALDLVGEHEAAERFHQWCAQAISGVAPAILAALRRRRAGEPVEASSMPPARFSLDGDVVADEWPNFQIDGYGTWLWSLEDHLRRTGSDAPGNLAPAVEWVARYISELGTSPCYDVWEEYGGSVHTTTLGCVCAGLRSAAAMLGTPSFSEQAEALRARLLDEARNNGRFRKSNDNTSVDASSLWLCEPFGLVGPAEGPFAETVREILRELDFEGGLRRYPEDTYYGGGAWPVLTASLGLCQVAAGDVDAAGARLEWVGHRVDKAGRLAEQFWGERRDPVHYREWVDHWGPPAADLVWSHAMYVALACRLDEVRAAANVTTTTEPIGS